VTTRALIGELIAAWANGDALRACAFFDEHGVYRESHREPISGRDSIFQYFVRFFREGPPWKFEVDEIITEGDRAAVSYCFAMKGDDDKWRERPGCAIVHCREGLIFEWREYYG
jgi:ketosteroid isomerase-like protein